MPANKNTGDKPAKRPVGRPSKFTTEVKAEILSRLSVGESIRHICQDDHLPAASKVYEEIYRNAEFREQYTQARREQAEYWAEEIVDIADDGLNDWILKEINGKEIEVLNTEAIQRSKLRIDTRKWLMSKLLPKKYGDKLEVSGDEDKPIKIIIGGSV